MDKTAQERTWRNKLRDLANIPAEKMTGFFRPEHERVMKVLREMDDRIRSELTGKQIGTAMPTTSGSAKDLLKSARKNFNRNEFITGISELAAFHEKMYYVVKDIEQFSVDVNRIHHKFLFEGVDEEKIKRLRSHMERKAELELALMMTKEAGIMDFFHNIGTPRGRALSAWVKKYPKETKVLRERGMALIDAGQALFDNTLGILKKMATARATRRPDDYSDEASKIKAEFAKFDAGEKGFTTYYNNVVMPFMKTRDDIAEQDFKSGLKPAETTPAVPERGTWSTVDVPGATPPSPAAPPPVAPQGTWMTAKIPGATTTPASAPMGTNPPGSSPPFAPPAKTEEIPPPPDTQKSLPPTHTHARFMESLEAMSGEDPRILAGYIAKYAKQIQAQDPEVAIQLFSIVRQLRS